MAKKMIKTKRFTKKAFIKEAKEMMRCHYGRLDEDEEGGVSCAFHSGALDAIEHLLLVFGFFDEEVAP